MEGTNKSIKQLVGQVFWKDFGSLTFFSLLPNDFQEQLALPKILYTKLKLPPMVSLQCPGGSDWIITVTTKDDHYCFSNDGWRHFVDTHSLEENNLLFFEYNIDTSCFKVTSLDISDTCAEVELIPPPLAVEDKNSEETSIAMVHEIAFPPQIFVTICEPNSQFDDGSLDDSKPLICQVDFVAYGVQLEPQILTALQQCWFQNSLGDNVDYLDFLVIAPVKKCLKVEVLEEIEGFRYIRELGKALSDGLAAEEVYDDEKVEVLEMLYEFFRNKNFTKNSTVTYNIRPNLESVEIVFSSEGNEDEKITVENVGVIEVIQRWYLGGPRGVAPASAFLTAEELLYGPPVAPPVSPSLKNCLSKYLC